MRFNRLTPRARCAINAIKSLEKHGEGGRKSALSVESLFGSLPHSVGSKKRYCPRGHYPIKRIARVPLSGRRMFRFRDARFRHAHLSPPLAVEQYD